MSSKVEHYDKTELTPGTIEFAESKNKSLYAIRTGEALMGSLPLNHYLDIGSANAYKAIISHGIIKSEGANTSTNTDKLIDAGATFESDIVKIGHTVLNLTDNSEAKVVSIDSQTQLTLDADIFQASSKSYKVGPDIFQLPQAYVEGLPLKIKASNDNTGISTLNINGLGAKTIKLHGGGDIPSNTIVAGKVFIVDYDGTNFIIRLEGVANGGAASGIDTILSLMYLIKERSHDISQIDDNYLLEAFIGILNFELTLGNEYISSTEILFHLDYNSLHNCEATTDLSNEGAQSGAVALNSNDKIEGSNSVKTTITSGLNGVENGIVYTLPANISLYNRLFRVGTHLSTISNIDKLRIYLYSDTDYKYWDFTSGLVADFNHLEVDPTTAGNGSSGTLDINAIDEIKIFVITNATQSVVLSIDDLCDVSSRNIPIKKDIHIVNINLGTQEILSLTNVSGVKCTMDTALSHGYTAANSAIKRNLSITDINKQLMEFIDGLPHESASHTSWKRLLNAVIGARLDVGVTFENNINRQIAVVNSSTSFSLQDDLAEKDSYDISNKDSTEDSYGVNWNGQAILNSNTYYIAMISCYLQKSGSATGNADMVIYNCTGTPGSNGKPTGSILATSNAIDMSTVGSGSPELVSFYFATPLQVTDDYCIILKYEGGDASNKILFGIDSSGNHSGNFTFTDDSGTTFYYNATKDAIFSIYTFGMLNELKNGYPVGFYKQLDIGTGYSYPQSDLISNINADLTILNNLPTIAIADSLSDIEIDDHIVLLPKIAYSLVAQDTKEVFNDVLFNKLIRTGEEFLAYPTGILAHWKLDETSGVAINALAGYAMTISGTIGYTSGKIDGARGNFSSGYTSWVAAGSSSTIFDTTIFMVEGWFKISSATRGILISKSHAVNYGWLVDVESTNLRFRFGTGIGMTMVKIEYAVNDGLWHYFTCAVLATSGADNIRIFIDGQERAAGSGVSWTKSTGNLIIGAFHTTPISRFEGLLDDICYHNSPPITWSEVSAFHVERYNNGNGLRYGTGGREFLVSGTEPNVSGKEFSLKAEILRGDTIQAQSKITGYLGKIII